MKRLMLVLDVDRKETAAEISSFICGCLKNMGVSMKVIEARELKLDSSPEERQKEVIEAAKRGFEGM
jgi:hypothetical protein